MRHRHAGEVADACAATGASATGVSANVAIDGATESVECERVLQECRNHMQMLGQNQVLLSMLGLALSLPAHAYLRRSNLGLKHFLMRFPNEFHIKGPKGSEHVIWCGPGVAAMMPPDLRSIASFGDAAWSGAPHEPSTPKLMPSSSKAGLPHSAHCVATPSDWGTPAALPSQLPAQEESSAAAGLDFTGFPSGTGWSTYGWPPPWAHPGWPNWPSDGTATVKGSKAACRSTSTSGKCSASRCHRRPWVSHRRPMGQPQAAMGQPQAANGSATGGHGPATGGHGSTVVY